ncbi:hypothetical protein [Chloracidobacterium aggregatum]|uniref:DUF7948 domain-containing protein n=1 Tax=Chloracidobacterium sp. N TaxID=2821540 RepID=A0ABX8AZT8_9BACT|nr:hypothetical protein [Chloracidobacterium aggregatum]QUV84612.1 hypothetical protein J8C03_10855 [Chloracidobacterium sp. 2]QUV86888.1 hypothetical protein J8C07_06650 [Chloracidobacterium sp. S]QUV89802.1 hypothetical protein J8C04_05760 [Chloracidobacterium sp. A]QUV93015.1 hypothetical protein J8C05_06395 [Chloracidobacterium sp. N]
MKHLRLSPLRRWLAVATAPLIAFTCVPLVARADRDASRPSRPVLKRTGPVAPSAPAAAPSRSGRLLFEENLGQHAGPVRYKMFGGSVFLTDRAEACMLVEAGREPLWRPTGKAAENPRWKTLPASRPVYRALRMQPVERETGRPVPPAASEGMVRSPIALSYCKGDRSQWRSRVPLYREVVYHQVYPGIDLVYYPKDERLTYDFRVAPGADPSAIRLHFEGADRLALDLEGNLHCLVGQQTVVMQKPTLYQEVAGERRIVPGRFTLTGNDVAFEIGTYDRNLALVIDPVLPFYSTYFGGNQDDEAVGVAVGRIYNRNALTAATVFSSPDTIPVFIAGTTFSPSLPVPVGSGPNANNPITVPDVDIFVARFEFRADGTVPANIPGVGPTSRFAPWNDFTNGGEPDFTYDDRGAENGLSAVVIYGGTGDDVCTGVSINANQNATEQVDSTYFRPATGPVLVGYTTSTNFPTGRSGLGSGSATTFQSTFGGGFTDAFAMLLPFCLDVGADNITSTPTSPIAYSTYLGGSGNDLAWACAAEQGGGGFQFAWGGETDGNLPTNTSFDSTYGGGDADGFVARFNPELNSSAAQRRYVTYFGGNGYDAVTGISDFSSSGPRVGVTGITGSDPEADFIDAGSNSVTSAVSGAARNGDFDAFVAMFTGNTGPSREFSMYLGGNNDDWGMGIYARRRGVSGGRYVVHVAGLTDSTTAGFGVPLSGSLSTANKGGIDAFVTQISWDGNDTARTVQYFGYLGTTGDDEAYALATSEQSGPTNSIVYVGGISNGTTAFTPVGIGTGLPNFANDLLYPASSSTIPVSRGFLARISAVNEGGTNLPATLQNLVNVGGRTFATGAQPIQRVLGIAPYLVAPASENRGVLFFTGSTNANNVLPASPPAPYNVFQDTRANNTSDRKDAYLGSVRLTP